MAANFDKYLDVEVEDVERPTPPPIGHYFATIKSHKTAERDYGKADGSPKSPVVEVFFTITSPDDDVDTTMLPETGVSGRQVSKDYQLNDPIGQFQLRQLGEETCGLDTKGLKFRDMLPQLVGQEVKLYMEQRADKNDPEVLYPVVKKVLKAQ